MNKVSILNYLVHVDLVELFVYLLPVLSLIALIRANSHLKRHVVTIQKTKKDRKKKNRLFTMLNVLILASMVGYMVKHELPQKDYFYKKSISKKQIRFDQEHFLLTGDSK